MKKKLQWDFKDGSSSEEFTYYVIWSDEDKEHVGLCKEHPSLSWLHRDEEEALKGIKMLVREIERTK